MDNMTGFCNTIIVQEQSQTAFKLGNANGDWASLCLCTYNDCNLH